MRISNKSDYALRALFDLAQHIGRGPIQSDEIARRQGVPVNYLNQLLITLRRAGLIESMRGPQGGHMLARAPENITLRDILIAIDGPLLTSESTRDDRIPTVPEDYDLVDEIWAGLRNKLELVLTAITLDTLCQRKRQHAGNVMYYI
ncbi:MAG: Rrf2 family transcriptional regulator [Oscillochloris sp.]|nr:Rrf2 family transcriptional regulator [Oscillochloris sp.]